MSKMDICWNRVSWTRGGLVLLDGVIIGSFLAVREGSVKFNVES